MPVLTIHLPIAPFGKARPRAVIRGRRVSVAMPTRYTAYKRAASGYLFAALQEDGWAKLPPRVPVGVRVVGVHPRPKRRPAGIEVPAWATSERVLRLGTPDADNLEGAVWDALNDTRLCWHDDAQALSLGCWSWYGAREERAAIIVSLVVGGACPDAMLSELRSHR